MSIPDEFERRLMQVLTCTATVVSFDRGYLEAISSQYSQDIISFCELLERPLHHWMGSEVTEHNVARMLVRETPLGKVPESPVSLYRAICRALEERNRGVICIYDVEDLPNEAFQLLSRLIRFVRDKNLRWQFLLIGDVVSLSPINTGMLHIDIRYPYEDEPTQATAQFSSTPDSHPQQSYNAQGQSNNKRASSEAPLATGNGPHKFTAGSRSPWLLWSVILLVVLAAGLGALSMHESRSASSEPMPLEANVAAEQTMLERTPSALNNPMSKQLERAYRLANISEVDRLTNAGESINAVNQESESGLIMAVRASDRVLVKALLKRRANPNLVDQQGQTALFYACHEDKADIVKRLLEAGADANAVNQAQKTPLTVAARAGSLTIVKLLLRHGADSDWQDQQGWTPLFYAAWTDNPLVAKVLLTVPANKLIKDNDGYTAIDIARIRRSEKVSALLN